LLAVRAPRDPQTATLPMSVNPKLLPTDAILHRVTLEVSLLQGHPVYYDASDGAMFHVWLFAPDVESAKRCAKNVAEAARCQVTSDREFVTTDFGGSGFVDEFLTRGEQSARVLGLAYLLVGWPVGEELSGPNPFSR
ncbi:MAG: hypothetical protein ABIR71_04325, partial [Chthoniobacterales bacterium]